MKKIIAFTAIILFFASCDRSFEFDTISVTSPELHVFVTDAGGSKLSGATVTIYKSMDSATQGSNPLASESTDNEGKAVFTEEDLADPGKFFVKAEKNGVSTIKETPYLLLNDGHTYFNITIQ